jgi:hypothetical protein
MADDSYHTIGAQKDRQRTFALKEQEIKVLGRIADASERIADTLEALPQMSEVIASELARAAEEF